MRSFCRNHDASSAALRLFACALISLSGNFALWIVSAVLLVASTALQAQSHPPVPIYSPANKKANVANVPHKAPRPKDSGSNGSSCTLLTFEGLGDLAAIPTFEGVSLPDWLSIIQDTAGGSGNFADAPSGVTIAFWLDGNPNSQTVDVPNGATNLSVYYSSFYSITLTAYDADGNVLSTATGPSNFDFSTDVYDIWSPLSISAPSGKTITSLGISGYANYTGIDNLNVCQTPTVASVEATQAIQQYQTLADLKTSLAANGEPPVPMISGKPAVLRTYFNTLQVATPVTLNISGVVNDSRTVTLPPNCTPEMQRAQIGVCKSVDFYFTPPTGSWQATLDVLDSSGNTAEEEMLPFTSLDTNSLLLKAASVCDAKDTSGAWLCEGASALSGKEALLAQIAPTGNVSVQVSPTVVHEDFGTFNNDIYDWANAVDSDLGFQWLLDFPENTTPGQRTTYFGMVRPAPQASTAGQQPPADPLQGLGGKANGIPSHGAFVRSQYYPFQLRNVAPYSLGPDLSAEGVAHESGHTLGLYHTGTGVPAGSAPPSCWGTAKVGNTGTDWTFSNNYIQSTQRFEVGFNMASHTPLNPVANASNPNSTFELMGYCSPYWISPQRYKTMIYNLGGGKVESPSVQSEPGPFWLVAGSLNTSSVTFQPLFTLTLAGDKSVGTGTYSLIERSSAGTALFTRQFNPTISSTDFVSGVETPEPPTFSELLPVLPDVASIVVVNSDNAEVGRITLGGTVPKVTILSPSSAFKGNGTQTVSWSVQGPTNFTSKVLYSTDNGTSWTQIAQTKNETSDLVDFDQLPGSSDALIEVLVSDGVNTGMATSPSFDVPRKKPTVAIIESPKAGFSQPAFDSVYLRGTVYDTDDGALAGSALQWSSDQQGVLGSGSPLSVKLKAGPHTITLTGTDSDGNTISTSTKVVIGGAAPTVSLNVQTLNQAPTTCEFVTIGASSGAAVGAPLSSIQYSLDGGATYESIALTSLPYGFVVPESGFVHLVANAADMSGQAATQDTTFFAQSACSLTPQTITFATLSNQTYGVAPIKLKATASSGLPVSFAVTGPATLSGSTLSITGAGTVVVTASQAGNGTYSPASLVSQTVSVAAASLTVTAASLSRPFGEANPTLTYTLTGFVDGDTKSVVGGSATLSTTATVNSPVGTYPISFSTEALTAANYTFTYVPGTLTVIAGSAPATPTFSPAGGTYSTAQTVKLADTTSGAAIYYTTNGAMPNAGSTLYTTPINVAATETIEAVAIAGGVSSSVSSATYTINTSTGCNIIDYANGFTASGLSLNGGAAISGGLLQLTDGKDSETRSAFYTTEVPVNSFVTDFTFQLLNPSADGFAFVIQTDSAKALGADGGGLGYAGIKNSGAIKFDLHNNEGEGPNSTGLYLNGAFPGTPAIDLTPSGIDLHSGHIFAVHITYTGSSGTITITDTVTSAAFTSTHILSALPSGEKAYVGFTAGTGHETATQSILTWTYSTGNSCN